jgi:RNA polymerase sigma-70 factor (ECF subfamily)
VKNIKEKRLEILFNNLYSQYVAEIYKHVYRLIGNREESEQLTQQSFTKLFSIMTTSFNISNERAFVYRIATNACYDYLRRNKKLKLISNSEMLYGSTKNNLEEQVLKTQREETIRQALRKLSFQEQVCILLYKDGFSYKEIAETAKMKKTSVGKTLSRATQKLKQIISNGEMK